MEKRGRSPCRRQSRGNLATDQTRLSRSRNDDTAFGRPDQLDGGAKAVAKSLLDGLQGVAFEADHALALLDDLIAGHRPFRDVFLGVVLLRSST